MSRGPRRRASPSFDRGACGARLAAGLADMAAGAGPPPLDERQRECLLDYLETLAHWNATHNLTAIRHPSEMVTRHLLDCLAIAGFIDASPVADVGSGAGLPGLVLAVARPELAVTLFEASRKKIAFLRHARRTLGLDNVEIVGGRVEAAAADTPFAWVVTRAFASAADTLAVAGHLLAEDGRLGLMKARAPEEELAGLPAGFLPSADHEIRVPGLSAERRFIVVERARG